MYQATPYAVPLLARMAAAGIVPGDLVSLLGCIAESHDVLADSPVTALCATIAGDLVVATGERDIVLVSVLSDSIRAHAASQALVTAFLDLTTEVPDDGNPGASLVVTDGTRTWEPDALETVTTATASDPTWLRLRAAVNSAFAQEK